MQGIYLNHLKIRFNEAQMDLFRLGSVDLYRLNFVQSKSVLIAASEMWPSHLSEFHSTKSKTLLDEPEGQRLLTISTALSPIYVEQPHCIGSALYKKPTNSCKNNLERSTAPRTSTFCLEFHHLSHFPRIFCIH